MASGFYASYYGLESEDDSDNELSMEAIRKRSERQEETPEQRQNRLLRDREHKRKQRQEATPEQRERDRERKQLERQEATPEQRQRDRERKRLERQKATPEQRQRDQDRKRLERQNESFEQRRDRLQGDQERHYQRRHHPTRKRTYLLAFISVDNVHQQLPEEHSGGQLDRQCEHCGALHFKDETRQKEGYNDCCNFGTIKLNELEYPIELRRLLDENTSPAQNFRANIRHYNSALAMASMGAKIDTLPGGGPYCFRIHGQVYHLIGPLQPDQTDTRQYAQFYILDSAMAADERMGHVANTNCDRDIMLFLSQLLERINPYAKTFRMMKDIADAEDRRAQQEHRPSPQIELIFDISPGYDRRRYNVPITDEVAAVFVLENDDLPPSRSFAIHFKGGGKQYISDIDPRCDPLTYPILFPKGESGWSPDLTKLPSHRKRQRITQMEYYSYRLSIRLNDYNAILRAGKLFQQYIVDAYVRLEQNRLNYDCMHQTELRAEHYRILADHLATDNANDIEVGRRIILPSTFPGSPRAMIQSYQDAMSIVAKFGKPDFFITMTCNPKWREITENLLPHQTPSDRPDIVARVFNIKLKAMLQEIIKDEVLGKVIAYMAVIEFQKRGLPHCHALFIMDEEDKIRTPEDADRVICAEIPDPASETRLYEIVTTMMMHGICGPANPAAPCMVDGVCSKHFPKNFRESTSMDVDGYPEYRRRNNGRYIETRYGPADNRWVVPYNKYLSAKYNCHINVEICATITSIKYLYKYVYKGPDRAAINIQRKRQEQPIYDEILAHLDARYVSPPEAAWRIFGFDMEMRSHTIYRLAVHLPEFQTVYFQQGNEAAALDRASAKDTTLTAWFKLNAMAKNQFEEGIPGPSHSTDPRQFLYYEIPEHYVFDRTTTTWTPRQQQRKQIGRIYTVSPREEERYYLRVMLLYTRGATSFTDLRTVNGVIYSSFKDAARAAGYLKDDNEYRHSLQEATFLQMPSEMRALFAYIISFCEINNIKSLWDEFKTAMSEDYRRQAISQDQCEAQAYADIARIASNCGFDITNKIPPPRYAFLPPDDTVINTEEYKRKGAEMHATLNREQKLAADAILSSVNSKQRCFFIDGPGGSGKTYLYTTLNNIFMGQGKRILSISWSGIAATLLPLGQTAHSAFHLPVPLTAANFTSLLKSQSKQANALRQIDVIIWDEVSMVPRLGLEAVDILLRDITQSDEPFGGKIIILGGDFRQIPPVVPKASKETIIEASIKKSTLWRHFQTFTLTRNMRAHANAIGWPEFLLRIGNGEIEQDEQGRIELPQKCLSHDLIRDVFGEAILPDQIDTLPEKAILTPKNVDSLSINNEILQLLPGNERVYNSIDEAECDENVDITHFPLEFLNSLTPAGYPPHQLRLKIGAVVMLMRNLDVKNGLCNGTRLIVERMENHIIGCRIAVGSYKGKFVLIPRITICPSDATLPFRLKRHQFPVRLSFAMTINKSQGQTFKKVGLYLPKPIFSHGQLYVALSRARCMDDVKIFLPENETKTANIVHRELLL